MITIYIFFFTAKFATDKSSYKEKQEGQKRGWESWTIDEKDRFFNAIKDLGRDFDNITERVGTKNYEQVHFIICKLSGIDLN